MFGFQTATIVAQDNQMKSEFEIIQDAFGLQKKDIIATFIGLEGVDVDAFWKVYNEYEAKRKELGKVRLELLYNYSMEIRNGYQRRSGSIDEKSNLNEKKL